MKWLRRGIVLLVGLVLLAAAVVFGGSEMMIRRHIPADLPRVAAATDPLEIAEGARLARYAGCIDCHGTKGQVMFDEPAIARITAPALSRVAEKATDSQLARAIRNGVGIDSRPLYVMPTQALNHLSDQDVSRLIGWIRSLPTTAFDTVEPKQVKLLGRIGVVIGQFGNSVNQAGGQPARRPANVGPYLVQTVCMECHLLNAPKTEAGTGTVAPPLAPMVASYDPVALKTLLRTGKAVGNREVGLMSRISRAGLNALTDPEVDAVQAYLRTQVTH